MEDQSRLRFRGRPVEHEKFDPVRNDSTPSLRTQKPSARWTASDSNKRDMEYTNLGVWDYYEQRWTRYDFFPGVRYYFRIARGLEGTPHALRLIQDTFALAPYLFVLYVMCFSFESVLPAFELKYNMQVLNVIQSILGSQTGDVNALTRIVLLRASCHLVRRICTFGILYATQEIGLRVQSHFSQHIVNAYARLDLPTFENEAVRSQLESVGVEGSPTIWSYILSIFTVFGTLIEFH
ncbi:unnamed protein product [Rhizoctonia solani]|uniref:Uncharacterized protein n=1 Tax=Rhizoctonia solani TaxID=456999 RepID=A0A8H3HNF8_9AGAM|nr:unnamed protein product [Rhizoctonia solani]